MLVQDPRRKSSAIFSSCSLCNFLPTHQAASTSENCKLQQIPGFIMARWHLLSLLAAAAHSSAFAGLLTHSEGVESVKTPFSGLTLQKQWAVSGSDFSKLEVRTFGRVLVELATEDDRDGWSSEQLASITVYSDASDLLEIFDVAPIDQSGLSLRVKNQNAEAQGLLYSRVRVLKESLQDIELTGSADIFVGDHVVSSGEDAKLSLVVTGSGDLDLGLTTDLSIGTLGCTIDGSGDVRVNAPTVSVSKKLELEIDGSGDIVVTAESVELSNLEASISGSGDIVVDQESGGSCSKENIVLSGSGDIDTASVACNSVSAELIGSGDIKFQAVDDLNAVIIGSGELEYANSLPEHVKLTGAYSQKRLRSSLRHTSLRKNHKYRRDGDVKYRSENLPRYVEVRVIASSSRSHPSVRVYVDADPNSAWATGNGWGRGFLSLASADVDDSDILILGLGSGGGVGLAIYAYIRRQRRQGYNILA